MQSLSALLGSLPQQPPRCAPLASRAALRGAALRLDGASASGGARRGSLHVCAAMECGVGIMGNKAGMTSFFTKEGLQVPVTVIALLPGNIVTQARARARSASAAPAGWPERAAAAAPLSQRRE